MKSAIVHVPVLLEEVLKWLDPKPGQRFIDATIGGGGHALAILEKIQPDGGLLGVEWDPTLFENLKLKIENSENAGLVTLVNDSYANLTAIAKRTGFEQADGVFLDLGMSSWHLEAAGRGFSFQKDEPLDMRFNPLGNDETAAKIVNQYPEEELARIFKNYGEERFARKIAEAIVGARKQRPIISTFQLIEVVKDAVPFWYRSNRRIHFATRTFQALRIAVNHELENLQTGLDQAAEVLKSGGRLGVISFHSLEDRIVKNFFRDYQKRGVLKILTKKPIRAGLGEISQNPRARSAKLRISTRLGENAPT